MRGTYSRGKKESLLRVEEQAKLFIKAGVTIGQSVPLPCGMLLFFEIHFFLVLLRVIAVCALPFHTCNQVSPFPSFRIANCWQTYIPFSFSVPCQHMARHC